MPSYVGDEQTEVGLRGVIFHPSHIAVGVARVAALAVLGRRVAVLVHAFEEEIDLIENAEVPLRYQSIVLDVREGLALAVASSHNAFVVQSLDRVGEVEVSVDPFARIEQVARSEVPHITLLGLVSHRHGVTHVQCSSEEGTVPLCRVEERVARGGSDIGCHVVAVGEAVVVSIEYL